MFTLGLVLPVRTPEQQSETPRKGPAKQQSLMMPFQSIGSIDQIGGGKFPFLRIFKIQQRVNCGVLF